MSNGEKKMKNTFCLITFVAHFRLAVVYLAKEKEKVAGLMGRYVIGIGCFLLISIISRL
jgi:hypothetical protein